MSKIEDVYEKVVAELRPKVLNIQLGLLYKAIQIILLEEELPQPEKTIAVCKELGINPENSLEEDISIINILVRVEEFEYLDIREIISKFFRNLIGQSPSPESKSMEKITWIVFGACALVGIYFCLKYLQETQLRKNKKSLREHQDIKQQFSLSVSLGLVVPAAVASTLKIDSNLNTMEIEHLIDSALYFLATERPEMSLNEQKLDFSNDYISSDSQEEVYVRIDIDDGQALIDQKIPFILKTNLPRNGQFLVKQRLGLASLSGLEKFKRI